MAGIRGKDTGPEMTIRRGLHRLGFRYRLHVSDLPGKPDLVFPRLNAVIFIHGCFWHAHDCHLFRWPSTRQDFWKSKIEGNRRRDVLACTKLRQEGWRILTVWECAIKGRTKRNESEVVTAAADWLTAGNDDLEIRGIGNASAR